ncbi:bifunctional DNA primase/polymerase [Luteipulveratus flavus]|uniref:Uncharacterized protein n=1 Tax=Luteipulveratus flavus TaxID=3031728 RepID=A0ABT6C352_9MICO|nr:hypothetical protein [Luteipulveratus sp. YIM 133296]MDF8263287.1 hypothetical protein [Luteipulveratus sp. YIM 133296]
MGTPLSNSVISSNDDLLRVWRKLMGDGGFGKRSLWLIFLDDEGRPAPLVVPIDDIPPEPDPEDIRRIADLVRRVQDELGVRSVPMLISRPGPSRMTDSDRRWAVGLTGAFADQQAPWPIHLATADDVQVFTPDDLIAQGAA